jgi:hypothetical protein
LAQPFRVLKKWARWDLGSYHILSRLTQAFRHVVLTIKENTRPHFLFILNGPNSRIGYYKHYADMRKPLLTRR